MGPDYKTDEAWCIIGSNHSGMDDYFDTLCTAAGRNTGIVSFKNQQAIYESELQKDETDFIDRIDPGTPAKHFIRDINRHTDLIEAFDMTVCLEKGYRQLSSGQSRKLLLLSEFTRGISRLLIQSPFEGLDQISTKELENALFHLYQQNIQIILFVQNISDIPSWCTHLGVMAEGQFVIHGSSKEVLAVIEQEFKKELPDFQADIQDLSPSYPPAADKEELVCLTNGFAGYEGKNIFEGLSLTIRKGDHTLVTGPNGSGKSTLLHVITGDHPACYQNNLKLFGIQRGTGESIWELKKNMGIVSSDLHRNYVVPGNTLCCIISGLFDSIGVYQKFSTQDEQLAMNWLERLSLGQKAFLAFRDLSFAQQRLVLIARALIKVPKLLILDEPTQGLDELNRIAVLDFLEDISKKNISTILYVSHRQDEYRNFFVQRIQMK